MRTPTVPAKPSMPRSELGSFAMRSADVEARLVWGWAFVLGVVLLASCDCNAGHAPKRDAGIDAQLADRSMPSDAPDAAPDAARDAVTAPADLGADVATDGVAMPVDDVNQVLHALGVSTCVPHVGVTRNDFEQGLFALPANHDWRMWLRERLGIAYRVDHLVVTSLQRGFVLGKHALDDAQRLIERLQAAGDGFEIDPEALVLELEPAGPNAEVKPPARHIVEGRRHLRGETRIPIGVADE